MDFDDWRDDWEEEPDFLRARSDYQDDTTLEGAMNYQLYILNSPSRSDPDTGTDSIEVRGKNVGNVQSEGRATDYYSQSRGSQPPQHNSELGKRMPGATSEDLAFTQLSTTVIGQKVSGATALTVKPMKKSKPTEIPADVDLDEIDFGNVKFLNGQALIDFYRNHKVYSAYPELLDPSLSDKDRKTLGHSIRKRISAQDIRNKRKNKLDNLEKKVNDYEAKEKAEFQEEIQKLKEQNEMLLALLKSGLISINPQKM